MDGRAHVTRSHKAEYAPKDTNVDAGRGLKSKRKTRGNDEMLIFDMRILLLWKKSDGKY